MLSLDATVLIFAMPRSDTPTTDLIDLGSWQSGSSKA
jgi:hypothetical protein